MSWYVAVLKKFAEFRGRARRKEYWMFTLFNSLFVSAIVIAELALGLASESGFGPLSTLYVLIVLIPGLAVGVRRLHDTGRSGWWLLIGAIPLIGGLILLIFTVQDSQDGDNEYGPNPKAATV